MEWGGRCYLSRAVEETFFEVVTRKRKAGDLDGRYSDPCAAWVFDAAADRWTSSPARPGAREIRTAIAVLRGLDRLIAEDDYTGASGKTALQRRSRPKRPLINRGGHV